jgi:transcriptional regulator with XRE-family HTH domain
VTEPTLTSSDYLQRVGATFRSLINDLKRDEETAARELGVELSLIEKIIAGACPVPTEVIDRAVRIWPVNERDFFPIHDDAPDGVIVMRKEDSAASSRVLRRGGKDYYEYRDTAMSRVVMMRPEWIRILHPVNDCLANNPTVEWNNGHFLYQFTYFMGDVNYYYEFRGCKQCRAMVSGDSVFGLPFSCHTFATRRPAAPGLILALTYGGRLVGDPQRELSVLGAETARQFVIATEEQVQAQAGLIAMHARNGGYSVRYLAKTSGLSRERVERLLAGEEAVEQETLVLLARAMRVSDRELTPLLPDTEDGVVMVRGENATTWLLPDDNHPSYRVKELAGSRVTPCSKALELRVLNSAPSQPLFLETGLHEYGYHIGSTSVLLEWRTAGMRHCTVLRPDDSFYIKPFVPHNFTLPEEAEDSDARLLLLRVGGKIEGDTLLEASVLGTDCMQRIASETRRWYDIEGRSKTNPKISKTKC